MEGLLLLEMSFTKTFRLYRFYSSKSKSVFAGKKCCRKEIPDIPSINNQKGIELDYDSSDSNPFDDEIDEEIMQ